MISGIYKICALAILSTGSTVNAAENVQECWDLLTYQSTSELSAYCSQIERLCVSNGNVILSGKKGARKAQSLEKFTFVAAHPDTVCRGDACLADDLEYESPTATLFMGSGSTVFSEQVDWVLLKSSEINCAYLTASGQLIPRSKLPR
jgi:hypothetical protein